MGSFDPALAFALPKGRFTAQVVEIDTEPVEADLDRRFLHFDVTDRAFTGYAWDFPTIVGGSELVCRGVYELRDEQSAFVSQGPHVDVGDRLAKRLGGFRARRSSAT